MIRTLLIANRGEIACRIVRTARRMGIATVAVHSDADDGAPHVRTADMAVRIGPAEAASSYLDAGAILAAARLAGADAVHPGYGFLSENADFAEACAAAGLVFVGPPAEAIRAMADKARARILMAAAGVPVVPGYDGEDQSADRLAAEAERIGFPLLVKASAGGGGRGMRRVHQADDLPSAVESARREAENAFGSGGLILERLVEGARHVEVQVFADGRGGCIHLGARDCSAQRRHQKIVEESFPIGVVDGMARAAVACARAVDYVGAGTVEFIVGAEGGYHFLEMNTRLQVEHPVTEMVTGLDLVEWQLRVARGEPLPLRQEEVRFDGHAIEARLYAEDPQAGFRPQTGTVRGWRPEVSPDEPGLRIDAGVADGQAVTPFYDPMIAKLIAHGRDRDEAIGRLVRALETRPLFGLKTNRGFLLGLLASPDFRAGAVTTDLIDRWIADDAPLLRPALPSRETVALAAAWLALSAPGGWFRSTGIAACPITLDCEGMRFETTVRIERGRLAGVRVGGVDGGEVEIAEARIEGPRLQAVLGAGAAGGGALAVATVFAEGRDVWLDRDGRTWRFSEPDRLAAREAAADPSLIRSPVTGVLRALSVAAGDRVEAGEAVGMVEAMKMETMLAASGAGTVRAVRARAGDQVRAGDVIVELEPDG